MLTKSLAVASAHGLDIVNVRWTCGHLVAISCFLPWADKK